MTLSGRIENGKVVLDSNTPLPEGAKVEVHVIKPRPAGPWKANPELMKYSGIADDLPPDASQTIDRVLYGQPPE
jgi:hypothetical protein